MQYKVHTKVIMIRGVRPPLGGLAPLSLFINQKGMVNLNSFYLHIDNIIQ